MNQQTKLASALLTLVFAFSPAAWSQQTQSSTSTQQATSPERGSMYAYQNSPEHYYRLNFRVLNVSPEGKVVNSRSYNEAIASGAKSAQTSSIRTGDRVPVATGTNRAQSNLTNSLVDTQIQYIDIGTNIDVMKVAVVDQSLRLYVSASISSIASAAPANSEHPIVRQVKWNSYVTVPIGKPTLIFSSDNNADKGKTELELTATPISQ